MGFVNLKEMSKKLKKTEEEVEDYVELGIIKPGSYCYPALFGDGKAIAFFPDKAAADVKASQAKVKAEPEPKPEPEPEPEEDEEKGEPEDEAVPPEPEPEAAKGKGKNKDKK